MGPFHKFIYFLPILNKEVYKMKVNQDILVSCNQCTLKVPITQTTYDKDGKNLICFECYNKLAQGIEPQVYKTIQSADFPKKIHYKCLNCTFKFSRSEEFSFTGICVNCGKKNIEIEQKIVAKDRKSLLDY